MISIRSKITQKVLNYFFLHKDNELYINELVRKLDVDKRNLVKKLNDLENEGLLKVKVLGNLKLYSLNKNYPLIKEYEKITKKSFGIEKEIEAVLKPVKGISQAYLFGSYAQEKMETHSDLDLLVIGNHSSLALKKK